MAKTQLSMVPPKELIQVTYMEAGIQKSQNFKAHSWSTSEHTLRIYFILKGLPRLEDGSPQFELQCIAEFKIWDRVEYIRK